MKKSAALKCLSETSFEIKDGGQEMAAMMLMLINFNNACVSQLGCFVWIIATDKIVVVIICKQICTI